MACQLPVRCSICESNSVLCVLLPYIHTVYTLHTAWHKKYAIFWITVNFSHLKKILIEIKWKRLQILKYVVCHLWPELCPKNGRTGNLTIKALYTTPTILCAAIAFLHTLRKKSSWEVLLKIFSSQGKKNCSQFLRIWRLSFGWYFEDVVGPYPFHFVVVLLILEKFPVNLICFWM